MSRDRFQAMPGSDERLRHLAAEARPMEERQGYKHKHKHIYIQYYYKSIPMPI
jgi:hypothetical protein